MHKLNSKTIEWVTIYLFDIKDIKIYYSIHEDIKIIKLCVLDLKIPEFNEKTNSKHFIDSY